MSIKEFYPTRFKKQPAVQTPKQGRSDQEEASAVAENGEQKSLQLPSKLCGQGMMERIKLAAMIKELPIEDTCAVVRQSKMSSSTNVPCGAGVAFEAERQAVDCRGMEELSTSMAVAAIASASAAYSRRIYLEPPASSEGSNGVCSVRSSPVRARLEDTQGKEESGRSPSEEGRETGDVNMTDVGGSLHSNHFLAQSPPRLQHTILAHPIRRHQNGDALPHHAGRRQRSLQTKIMSDEKATNMQGKMPAFCSCEPFNMPLDMRATREGLEKLNELVAQAHRLNSIPSVSSPDRHVPISPMQGQSVNQDDVTNMLMCDEDLDAHNFEDNMYLSPSDSQRFFNSRFEHSSAPRSDVSIRSVQLQHEPGSMSPTWGLLHHSPSQGK